MSDWRFPKALYFLSSLTVKNKQSHTCDSNVEDMDRKEELPTKEEIEIWAESFDRLMASKKGRRLFKDFLRSEYSEENIQFWLACEELKKEASSAIIEEKARMIYEDYISILSPKEVSLDSKVREVINQKMVQPNRNTFDEAQSQIYLLMHRDSYPRFLCSHFYRKLRNDSSSSATATTSTSTSAATTTCLSPRDT